MSCDISSESRLQYHLTVKLFALNLRNFTCNFAQKFARTKNEIRQNSFALLLHNTVAGMFSGNRSELQVCKFRLYVQNTCDLPWETVH